MRWPWDHRTPSKPEEPRPEPQPKSAGRSEVLDLISKRLRECEEALRRNPNDPDALFTRGVFLARIGEYWRSLQCLERVTEINGEYPGVWHLKSSLYLRIGDHARARACRERTQTE
jgi:tetratricopeptide (TPR) repeat protein